MPELPSGTVTFLFTDIEGSTRLLQQLGQRYAQLLSDHHRLLRAAFQEHGGHELVNEGDSFIVAFSRAADALEAAVQGQRTLAAHPWPEGVSVRVRMGLHTGEPRLTPEGYIGMDVHRAARIAACGHGGQILLSEGTRNLVDQQLPAGVSLRGMGAYRLKDLPQPEPLFQGVIEGLPSDFPPLRSLSAPPDSSRPEDPLAPSPGGWGRVGAQVGVKKKQVGAIVAVAVLAALMGSIWLLRGRMGRLPTTSGTPSAIRSVAVLPLKNLSRDPAQDYFADGITDSLTTDLAHIHSLRVISFQSVQQYKGERRKSLPVIARELNVDAVIEGSVQSAGDTVMINAQLIRAATDEHLWAKRYTRKAADLLRAQNQIVTAIADAVQIHLTPRERTRFARSRTVNPKAQSHYFLGRFQFGQGTEAGIRQAIQEYQQAIRNDPGFAPAYAGIAEAYSTLSSLYIPPREAMPKAEAAARKALALDPDLAEAHSALGFIQLFYHWNQREAERELLKAIETKPNYSTAYLNYGLLLLTQGRPDEGLKQFRKAQDLEPTSAIISFNTEAALFFAGKYAETIAQARHTLEMEPKMSGSHVQMGLAYLYLGQKEAALAEMKKAAEMEPNSATATTYALGLAVLGRKAEAESVLNRFLERWKGKYVCAYEVACAYEGLKDRTKAMQWLVRGEEQKCDCLIWGGVEPWMQSIHKDPRYQALLARVGLEQ